MAATNVSALQALTLAALALPGVMLSNPCAAEDDSFDMQFSHYQEGKRELYNVQNQFRPIQVESVFGHAKFRLADRIKLALNFTQDTWGGATPIATAPLAAGGNSTRIVSGASPLLNPGLITLDKSLQALQRDPLTGSFTPATQLVHTLATASPETRKQGDFKLSYEWDEARLDAGAGVSEEKDYQSVFGSIGGSLDFNQKRTTLSSNLSYTLSDTNALLDHDAAPYIYEASSGLRSYNATHSSSQINLSGALNNKYLTGQREDVGFSLGLTQVLNKRALLEGSFGYTRSTGYMDNPYKAVMTVFVDPNQPQTASGQVTGEFRALLEKRPDERNQVYAGLRYVQHVDTFDAALHVDYRIFHDDWGINAHTLQADWVQPVADGWVVTPNIRYYTQDAADFYTPYMISQQALPGKVQSVDSNGNAKLSQIDYAKLVAHYSSDQRLSGYGALSGGLTVSKKIAKGISFEAGAEYYTHAGALKLGGGGEGAYADFDSYSVNAALKVDFAAVSLPNAPHAGHQGHMHHAVHAPAGVMFEHRLPNAGDMMLGYRYMYGSQNGNVQQGTRNISDQALIKQGCNGAKCYVTPETMNMHMHMLDIMYAPTDWLTLMLMPQFMDMNMQMRRLDGAGLPSNTLEPVDYAAVLHADHQHTTGGIGDTGMYALFKLFDTSDQHMHLTLGVTAPTGDVGIKLRDTHGVSIGFIHYGMQLGSGTWDFKPSLTYTGQLEKWSWGAQVSGTKRMESYNRSGFAFGDILQTTAWSSYEALDWLSFSLRGVYTVQGTLKGLYNDNYTEVGTMDYVNNYGGRFWDVGFGVSMLMPEGELQGNRLSFEWVQPVEDDVNGYQIPREAALSASWSYMF